MMLKPCPRCKADAEELVIVVKEEQGEIKPCKPWRKGWVCFECQHFDPAIGRERLVDRLE
jgi:hypothetical protein